VHYDVRLVHRVFEKNPLDGLLLALAVPLAFFGALLLAFVVGAVGYAPW
jgi:hypothetical protein